MSFQLQWLHVMYLVDFTHIFYQCNKEHFKFWVAYHAVIETCIGDSTVLFSCWKDNVNKKFTANAHLKWKACFCELLKNSCQHFRHQMHSLAEDTFDTDNPKQLQQLVWFSIHYVLARRGSENDRSLTKSSFILSTDDWGGVPTTRVQWNN